MAWPILAVHPCCSFFSVAESTALSSPIMSYRQWYLAKLWMAWCRLSLSRDGTISVISRHENVSWCFSIGKQCKSPSISPVCLHNRMVSRLTWTHRIRVYRHDPELFWKVGASLFCFTLYDDAMTVSLLGVGRLSQRNGRAVDRMPLAPGFETRPSLVWRVFHLSLWLITLHGC